MLAAAPDFDHAVVGAGLSGVMLARELLSSGGSPGAGGPRVLLADPRPPADGPVTFAFWGAGPGPLDRWTIGSWDSLVVVGHAGRSRTVRLDGWHYRAIDWGRARATLLADLAADPRVSVLPDSVDAVRDGPTTASLRVGGRWLTARWVYDSRPPSLADARMGLRSRTGVVLAQAFRGAWVHTEQDAVHTAAATLLDFSADDGADLGFTYVLPVSTRSAMVMAVRMGHDTGLPDPGPAIPRVVGDAAWHVAAEEHGLTPLVVPALPRRRGARVLAIGARGGRVRPSTGYAVTRIVADAAAIRSSLERHGHPFAVHVDPAWERTLDRIWLRALARERAGLEPAFLSLFTRAPVDAILRFLDGDAGPRDVVDVVRALPPRPFLRALLPTTSR